MRCLFLTLAVTVGVLLPPPLTAQDTLTPSNLPDFLAGYEKNFEPLQSAYAELMDQQLPLRDEEGRPLGRHPIEDRQQALADLREIASQLAATPEDMVLTTQLVLHSENLADDLFDLAQIAYDNDREELARQLTDLQATMDQNKDRLASYLLDLASANQKRVQQLEKENAELRAKLREAVGRSPAKHVHQKETP